MQACNHIGFLLILSVGLLSNPSVKPRPLLSQQFSDSALESCTVMENQPIPIRYRTSCICPCKLPNRNTNGIFGISHSRPIILEWWGYQSKKIFRVISCFDTIYDQPMASTALTVKFSVRSLLPCLTSNYKRSVSSNGDYSIAFDGLLAEKLEQ